MPTAAEVLGLEQPKPRTAAEALGLPEAATLEAPAPTVPQTAARQLGVSSAPQPRGFPEVRQAVEGILALSPLFRETTERVQERVGGFEFGAPGSPPFPAELAGARATLQDIQSIVDMEAQTVRHLLEARTLAESRGEEFDLFEPPRVKPPLPLEPTKRGLLQIAVDYATRPLSATAGGVKALVEGRGLYSALEEAGRGIKGEEKVFFSDVLEAAGVPPLGEITYERQPTLSTLAEERGAPPAPTVRREVTGRGLVGFVGDVFADPLTYLTLGIGRALRLGNGLALSARGEAVLGEQIAANAARGMARDAAREAAEEALKVAVDEGAQGLLHRGGVRWAGMTIPGTPEVARAFRTVAHQAAEKVRGTEAGKALFETAEKAAALFSRDFLVARYGDYVTDKQRYFDLLKADRFDIMDEATVIFGGTTKADRLAITRAIESGQEAIAQLPEHLQRSALAVKASQTALRQEEIARGLGESFLDDYMLHTYTNYPAVRSTGILRSHVSPALRSNQERVIPTLEEAKALGLKPVSEDAMDLFVLRKVASSRAQRAQDLIEETGRKFGRPEKVTTITEIPPPPKEPVPVGAVAKQFRADVAEAQGLASEIRRLEEAGLPVPKSLRPALEEVRERIRTPPVEPELVPTIQKTVERIPFERKIADDLVEAPNFRTPTGEAILLPRRIAEDLAAIGTEGQLPRAIEPLVRGYDAMLNFWKGTVTSVFPAFHARNAVTNVINSSLDIGIQSANPLRHAETLRVLRGADGTLVTRFGEEYTYAELRRLFRTTGVEGAFGGKLELETTRGGRLIGADNPLFRAGRAVGEAIEDEARAHHFLASIRRGFTPDEAAVKTKTFLFDYSNLSGFERTVLRRAIPFYTFYRKNIPLQAKALVTEPGRQAVFLKAFATSGDPAQIERERRLWPDYVSEGLALQVGTDREGNPLILWGTGLPIEDLNKILAQTRETESQVGRTAAKTFLGMMTPFAKFLIEEATGRDVFLNRPLDDVNRVYNAYGPVLEKLPKPVRDFLDFKKEFTRRGEARYTMDPQALHLVRSFVLSRLYSTVGKQFDTRKDPGTVWLNTLTGLRLGSLDAETQILPAIRRRAQERLEGAARIRTQEERRLLHERAPIEQRIGEALSRTNGQAEPSSFVTP